MRKKKNIGALTMADLIGCIRKIVTEELESTEKRMKEEFESGKKRIWTRIEGIFRDGNQASFQRNMKLQFKSRISQKILTGEEIKGEDKSPLELALVDEPTGNIVDGGPESSATVEILLLKGVPNASEGGDWTAEQFNQNIVREAKKPLFAENEPVKLENGIGFLKNIKFRHHAIKMKPSEFRLGARVVNTFDGVHIKEAKTESFVVKDFRNKYYIKHETPSLSDEVSRLVNIRKGGNIEKHLQDHKICTVEDFLIRLLTDSEGLKKIVNMGEKKWKLIVENALACPSDTRMYCYANEQRTTCVVFNLLGQILGLYMERQYTSTNMLPEKHKADAKKLLESAYKHWEKVESFDDESSLQQYLNGLDCPLGGREDTGTSEMIRGSSSRSNFSFSTMNSISETGVELQQYLNGLDCPVGGREGAGTSEINRGSSSRSNFSFSTMNSISETGAESNFSFSAMNSISKTGADGLDCPVGGLEDTGTSEMIRGSSSRSNFSFSTMNSTSDAGADLQQYLNNLDCPVGGREDAGTSEMIRGSSSRSNFSFSKMKSISETGAEDFSLFGTDDVGIIHDAYLQHSPFSALDLDNCFPDIDKFLNEKNDLDTLLDGLINESNADEFVEPKDVQVTRKPPNRWIKLLCVLKWFLIRKKLSVDRIRRRKKQKLG